MELVFFHLSEKTPSQLLYEPHFLFITFLPFFSLPANEIESFRIHLRCQLVFAQGVSLEPSIIQRFLEVFTAAVHENDPIECPPSMVCKLFYLFDVQ